MINIVLEGKYKGKRVMGGSGYVVITTGLFKSIKLNKDTVLSSEVITDEHAKSAASGVARGIVGGALLGPIGLLGGALSAKNKSEYHLAIKWQDGETSLLKVDGKVYRNLTRLLF